MGLWFLITWLLLGMAVVARAWPLICLAAMMEPELRDSPGLLAVVSVVLVLVWPLVLKDLFDHGDWL